MKVLLAIPTGGHFHYKLVPRVVEICKDKRYDVELFISHMIGNEANRNAITDYFLKGDYDFLLMLDTDQVPECNPLDMIRHDKDIVSAPTILNTGSLVWSVYDRCDDLEFVVEARTERLSGAERVYAVSTGCILIKRRVLEKMKHPFVPKRNEDDRRLVTQDILFCMRANEEGFEVWVDWDKVCRHYKEVDLLTI
jgi:hypothetical protein